MNLAVNDNDTCDRVEESRLSIDREGAKAPRSRDIAHRVLRMALQQTYASLALRSVSLYKVVFRQQHNSANKAQNPMEHQMYQATMTIHKWFSKNEWHDDVFKIDLWVVPQRCPIFFLDKIANQKCHQLKLRTPLESDLLVLNAWVFWTYEWMKGINIQCQNLSIHLNVFTCSPYTQVVAKCSKQMQYNLITRCNKNMQ